MTVYLPTPYRYEPEPGGRTKAALRELRNAHHHRISSRPWDHYLTMTFKSPTTDPDVPQRRFDRWWRYWVLMEGLAQGKIHQDGEWIKQDGYDRVQASGTTYSGMVYDRLRNNTLDVVWVTVLEWHQTGCYHLHALIREPRIMQDWDRGLAKGLALGLAIGDTKVEQPRSIKRVARYLTKDVLLHGGDIDYSHNF